MNNNTNLVLGIVIALIIGASAGYSFGKSPTDNGDKTKELQDSVVMMNDQAATIQKMAEMMKSSGIIMQELGSKYKEEGIIMKGKDLEIMGDESMAEVMGASEVHSSMKQMEM
ncbi:MAG: hypothetical protein Q7S11_02355 [bacterium]|nr:hypothetical protein [bacterium]